MSASQSMKNAKGQVITYTAEGRKKDPATWEKLDRKYNPKKYQTRPPGTTASGSKGTSSELGGLLGSLGIDRSILSGGYSDATDPDVYVGDPNAGLGWRKRITPAVALAPKTTTKKRSAVLNDFFGLTPDQLQKFQEQAFAAGLYGTADRGDVRWGDYDDDTFKLWTSLTDRAAGFYAAGKKVTIWDALQDAVQHPSGSGAGKGVDRHTTSSNPEVLREVITAAIQDAEGFKPGQARVENYVRQYLALERQHQTGTLAATEAGSGNVEDIPSAEDFATLQAKKANPAQVGAHGIAERADEFFGLLGAFGGGE